MTSHSLSYSNRVFMVAQLQLCLSHSANQRQQQQEIDGCFLLTFSSSSTNQSVQSNQDEFMCCCDGYEVGNRRLRQNLVRLRQLTSVQHWPGKSPGGGLRSSESCHIAGVCQEIRCGSRFGRIPGPGQPPGCRCRLRGGHPPISLEGDGHIFGHYWPMAIYCIFTVHKF